MKPGIFKIAVIALLASFMITACSVGITTSAKAAPASSKKVPPGKAKKAKGSKSARRYAPGHN